MRDNPAASNICAEGIGATAKSPKLAAETETTLPQDATQDLQALSALAWQLRAERAGRRARAASAPSWPPPRR